MLLHSSTPWRLRTGRAMRDGQERDTRQRDIAAYLVCLWSTAYYSTWSAVGDVRTLEIYKVGEEEEEEAVARQWS